MSEVKRHQDVCHRYPLRRQDGIDLTLTDMFRLNELSCSNQGITDLAGLENAPYLRSLDLSDNENNYLDAAAYSEYLSLIKENNPEAEIIYDPAL